MTPEEQRIAIANILEWKDIRKVEEGRPLGKPPGEIHSHPLPDYLRDLNAMHEAEKALNVPECSEYAGRLGYTQFDSAHATASERAEAFLKTKRLWKD